MFKSSHGPLGGLSTSRLRTAEQGDCWRWMGKHHVWGHSDSIFVLFYREYVRSIQVAISESLSQAPVGRALWWFGFPWYDKLKLQLALSCHNLTGSPSLLLFPLIYSAGKYLARRVMLGDYSELHPCVFGLALSRPPLSGLSHSCRQRKCNLVEAMFMSPTVAATAAWPITYIWCRRVKKMENKLWNLPSSIVPFDWSLP